MFPRNECSKCPRYLVRRLGVNGPALEEDCPGNREDPVDNPLEEAHARREVLELELSKHHPAGRLGDAVH